jgi:hypothetical protein
MGHFDIINFKLNETNISKDGYNIKDFNNFDLVLSGHYHSSSTQENIFYLGSTFNHTFNDLNNPKGYYIFDDDTLELTFIEFKESPKFYKFYNDDIIEESIKDNIIKLYITEYLSEDKINDIINTIQAKEPLELYIDYSEMQQADIPILKEDINSTLDET